MGGQPPRRHGGAYPTAEPIPVLQLPFIVPEIIAEVEQLRVVVFNLVDSRRKLLDTIEACQTLEELKDAIKFNYLETANPQILDGLKPHFRGPVIETVDNKGPVTQIDET